jgi:hypothetical protein
MPVWHESPLQIGFLPFVARGARLVVRVVD